MADEARPQRESAATALLKAIWCAREVGISREAFHQKVDELFAKGADELERLLRATGVERIEPEPVAAVVMLKCHLCDYHGPIASPDSPCPRCGAGEELDS